MTAFSRREFFTALPGWSDDNDDDLDDNLDFDNDDYLDDDNDDVENHNDVFRFFDRKGRLRLLGHHRNGVMVRCLFLEDFLIIVHNVYCTRCLYYCT